MSSNDGIGRDRGGPLGGGRAWQVDASLSVESFMRKDVAYLRENMWLDAAVGFLSERGLREAPVLDGDGRPVGVLYIDDVEREPGIDVDRTDEAEQGFATELMRGYGLGAGFHLDGHGRLRVREVMVPYIPEISVDTSIASAALVMYDNQLEHVMVVGDDGLAVGTFSREELVHWLVDQTSGRAVSVTGPARCLRDVMLPAITVRRRASLFTARDLMTTHDREELPVVEGGRVVGMVSVTDIYGLIAAHRDDDGWMQELLVEDVMKPPTHICGPGDSLDSALRLMKAGGGLSEGASARCVLVEEDGRLLGVVTARDLDAPLELSDPDPAHTLGPGVFPR